MNIDKWKQIKDVCDKATEKHLDHWTYKICRGEIFNFTKNDPHEKGLKHFEMTEVTAEILLPQAIDEILRLAEENENLTLLVKAYQAKEEGLIDKVILIEGVKL